MTNNYKNIKVEINGVWQNLQGEADKTLTKLLRDDLGLTGTKVNCEQGECGACTVLLDGIAVNSCLIFAASLDGRSVTTIEGLTIEGEPDPLQVAFMEADASQCGFCTPGMILSAKALLLVNADPTVDEIKTALAGNYCRCTGYTSIIKAVQDAAKKISRLQE